MRRSVSLDMLQPNFHSVCVWELPGSAAHRDGGET
jgi:hypothetical protein